MAKINLCTPLKGLDGEIIKDNTGGPIMLNQLLANVMVGERSETPVVALGLAQRLYNTTGEIEVNAMELTIIETVAKGDKLTTLASGQILQITSPEKGDA